MAAQRYGLHDLLAARTVAVIGAAQDPGAIGGRPIDYLRRAGFSGTICPVNPKYTELQGLPCYPELAALPTPADLAVVAVPARAVLAVLAECARHGVKGAIVYSSGFAEVGPEGEAMQAQMARLAQETGLRILGPNCQGLSALHRQLNLSFSSTMGEQAPGGIGLVVQSGAVGGMLAGLVRERSLGFAHWISTGNEVDLALPECIEFLAQDPDTQVIGAYAESIRDGRRLLAAVRTARAAGKPVVLLRAGRSAAAARAAASHTGAVAPENRVATALLRQAGAIEAADVQELLDYLYIFSRGGRPAGNRVAMISNSGGLGVIMSDTCSELGLTMPPLPAAAQAQLAAILPAFGATGNPVDTTAQLLADHSLLGRSLAVLLAEPTVDAVVVALGMINRMYRVDEIVGQIVQAGQQAGKPVLVSWVASEPEGAARLAAAGVPVFDDATRCLKALAALVRFHTGAGVSAPPAAANPRPAVSVPAGSGPLDEVDSTALLAAYGVPAGPSRLVRTAAEAVEAAGALGYPVALKACAAGIPHKSDHGLVRLGLGDGAAVAAAFGLLHERLQRDFPTTPVRGVLVQPMAPGGGVELALGARRDPVFGPVVMAALGGVFLEYLGDVALGQAPVSHEQALALLRSLRLYPLLAGARGRAPVDVEAVAAALAGLSQFACDQQACVSEVDINPLIALPAGQGAVAVDALVVRGTAAP